MVDSALPNSHSVEIQLNRTGTTEHFSRPNIQRRQINSQLEAKNPYDSKYELSTQSAKNFAILDSQNNTWTHLPAQFFESKTDGSSVMDNQKSVKNQRKITTSDIIVAQINKAVSLIELKQINTFKDCIDCLFDLKNGFQKLPKLDALMKTFTDLLQRENLKFQNKIEVVTQQCAVQIEEFKRRIQEAKKETEIAKAKLVDEENFRFIMMSKEKRQQAELMVKEWLKSENLLSVDKKFMEDRDFSGVADHLNIINEMANPGEDQHMISFSQEHQQNVSEIIGKQNLNIKSIETEQNIFFKSVQQQTAIQVLKRFYRKILLADASSQTESDLIHLMKLEHEKELKFERDKLSKQVNTYQDLKKDHEVLQAQYGNLLREKREKMVEIVKLEREIVELSEKNRGLQYEIDNQEAKQMFRIHKIQEQQDLIDKLNTDLLNLRVLNSELENQVSRRNMQLKHAQNENAEQSEMIDSLREQVELEKAHAFEKAKKHQQILSQFEAKVNKLESQISELTFSNQQLLENQAQQQQVKTSKIKETTLKGKEYGHLLENNILNDDEFVRFIESLKQDDRTEFEADLLEVCQRRIENWFKNDSVSADSSVIEMRASLKRRISISFEQKASQLGMRRRQGMISNVPLINLKSNNSLPTESDNLSQESSSVERSNRAATVKAQPKLPPIQEENFEENLKQYDITNSQSLNSNDKNSDIFDVKVNIKQLQDIQQLTSQKDPNKIQTIAHDGQKKMDDRRQTQAQEKQSVKQQIKAVPEFGERRKIVQNNTKNTVTSLRESNESFSPKHLQAIASQNQMASPSRFVARESLRIVVKGKCTSCNTKLTEEEKIQAEETYETLLKLQSILKNKLRSSTVPKQIFDSVNLKLQEIVSLDTQNNNFEEKVIMASKPTNLLRNKRNSSTSPVKHLKYQQNQQINAKDLILTLQNTQESVSFREQNLQKVGELLLDVNSSLNKPELTEQSTQTDISHFDRTKLLEAQAYLGKRSFNAQADIYTNLQAKMRHPDVPFIGQRTKLEPVLSQVNRRMANKSETKNL